MKHKGALGVFEKLTIQAKHEPLPAQHLFPHTPVLEDVRQTNLGDCWFLSALAAIVAMGSGWAIKYMMCSWRVEHDDHDYAIVRLHDPDRAPRFLLVEKSLITTSMPGKTFHSAGAPWAGLLEKATTAVSFSKRPDLNVTYSVNPEHAVYIHLQGGYPHIAFQALLGVGVRAVWLHKTDLHLPDVRTWNALLYLFTGDAQYRPDQGILNDLFGSIAPGKTGLFYTHAWEPWVRS